MIRKVVLRLVRQEGCSDEKKYMEKDAGDSRALCGNVVAKCHGGI